METYYFIDYENVGSDGLTGCDKLNKTDHIIIFFTRNANKIDMSEIANHGEADLDMIEVPAGKQSADIHIGSYLGYLAGINKGKDCRIVIISKDTDFDNVINFWKAKTGVKASRNQQIKISTPNDVTIGKEGAPEKNPVKVDGSKKAKLNQEVMQAVRSAGFDGTVANKVAQLAANLYGSERLLNLVHNALREKYSNYLEIYEAIKAVLHRYDKTKNDSDKEGKQVTQTSQEKSKVNSEIMKTLAGAGYGNDVTGYVASTVVKNLGVQSSKQQIYRAVISKYGQSEGLIIYNHIKKKI